jgi:serine/threonine-protein kinase
LQEPFNFSFLRRFGKVFRIFDQQDSGNICFGLSDRNRRVFVKYAGAMPVRFAGDPKDAVERLRKCAVIYRELAHPYLIRLIEAEEVGGGYAAVFEWTDAICMGKQYPTRSDFLKLPVKTRLGIFRNVLAFHIHVLEKGYVPVDFYDGSILYDLETNQALVCDIDNYEKRPYVNPVGRMFGSTRFMSPEEYILGAPIDERTAVYTMGAMAFALFTGEGGRALTSWELGPDSFSVAQKAVNERREERYPSLNSMSQAWEGSIDFP